MDNRSFDDNRIAAGYAKDRPWLHPAVMEEIRRDLSLGGKFKNGLDVGCGAGLSTRALALICEHVTGTDISASMVEAAREACGQEGFSFFQSSAETVAPKEPCDVVLACGVVQWVEQGAFLENLSRHMTDGGYLIVCDFWISDRMKGEPAYQKWWHEQYLPAFPRPKRRDNVWTEEEVAPYGFTMLPDGGRDTAASLMQVPPASRKNLELEWIFDKEAFIRFMMIQSNVNEQLQKGKRTEAGVRQWFAESLDGIFGGEKKRLLFDGYIWYIRRCIGVTCNSGRKK